MPKLRRKWKPHPKQREIMVSDARFRIVAAGRRFGKSEVAAHLAFEYAWTHPKSNVWWVAPTYSDAHDIGYEALHRIIPRAALAREPKRSTPRTFFLVNGSQISFRSGEREDSLRGRALNFLVIDEAASVPDHAWRNELRPSLSDTLGEMLAIGTPKGEGWFKEWFHRGLDDEIPDTDAFTATTYDNPFVEDSEVEEARSQLPERIFRQEYLAEFMSDEGAVFGNVRETNLADYDPEYRRTLAKTPYVTGIDLARTKNYLVAITLDAEGYVVKFRRERGGSWARLRGVMEAYLADVAPGTVYIDATRDNAVIEELDRNVQQRIESVRFGGKSKNEMIENLAARLEMADIYIPGELSDTSRNEPVDAYSQIVSELEAYQFETTKAGNIKYGPPAASHDDCVDALALAAKKAKQFRATW